MLTVYGIETIYSGSTYVKGLLGGLQQCLPFTVLKLSKPWISIDSDLRCNSAYRLRYWNLKFLRLFVVIPSCCNSAYRLRYAPKGARQQRSKATMRSAHLKCLNEVKVKQIWWGNSLTVYGIETRQNLYLQWFLFSRKSCNSSYRLRYAQKGARQ